MTIAIILVFLVILMFFAVPIWGQFVNCVHETRTTNDNGQVQVNFKAAFRKFFLCS